MFTILLIKIVLQLFLEQLARYVDARFHCSKRQFGDNRNIQVFVSFDEQPD